MWWPFRRKVQGPLRVRPDTLPWAAARWREDTVEWVTAHLEEQGITITGHPTPARIRPWSATFRIPTSEGSFWIKQAGPATTFEAALVKGLWDWTSWQVPEPILIDAERGLLVTNDAGPTLRETMAEKPQVRVWESIMAQYADVQRVSSRRFGELKSFGVPDQRPKRVARHLDRMLRDQTNSAEVRAGGLEPEQVARLQKMRRTFTRECQQLESYGLPLTIQHDDLHAGNVCVSDSGRHLIIDWGDAHRGHPFGTLLVTLNSIGEDFGLAEDDAALARIRDAYLEPWTEKLVRKELLKAVDLACRVDKVGRALAWERALVGATEEEIGRFGNPVPSWLARLEENP